MLARGAAAALLSILPRRAATTRWLTLSAAATPVVSTSMQQPGCTVKDHILRAPLDYSNPAGVQTDLFVRELVPSGKEADEDLPCLLYLQGGPGFPSPRPTIPPSGWPAAGLQAGYRVLLLDQRGTGRSSPVTTQSLSAMATAEEQAAHMQHFRADAIVQDCELIRAALAGGKKLTLLGQSFGGFCILAYCSAAPEAIEHAIFTVGLAPVGKSAETVYRATFKRMAERNRRFYERYPQVGSHLLSSPPLPPPLLTSFRLVSPHLASPRLTSPALHSLRTSS